MITHLLISVFLIFLTGQPVQAKEIKNLIFDNHEVNPSQESYSSGYLQVSDLHSIYFSQFGNPEGIPVLVVHGGPGGGCCDVWSNYFDLSTYRVIMFDQRGAMRSIPFAEMEDNTPQRSVDDMEALRTHLGVDKWILFGGSWGSTLSIFYGEKHPDRVLGFVLRGVFLARKQDYEHLFYGMRNTFPEAFDEMLEEIPLEERSDLIKAFHKRVMDPDPQTHLSAAKSFMKFDTICATLLPSTSKELEIELEGDAVLSVGRAFIHYAANNFFFTDNQLLDDIHKIAHLPMIIVHGRYDTICRPIGAYEIYKRCENVDLWFLPKAGHSSFEPDVRRALFEAIELMKDKIQY